MGWVMGMCTHRECSSEQSRPPDISQVRCPSITQRMKSSLKAECNRVLVNAII